MAVSAKLIFAFVLTSLAANSYQLQCYECSTLAEATMKKYPLLSFLGNGCQNFSSSMQITCSQNIKACWKVDLRMGDIGSGSLYSCGAYDTECEKWGSERLPGFKADCFTCGQDNCNSALGIFGAAWLLVLPLTTTVF